MSLLNKAIFLRLVSTFLLVGTVLGCKARRPATSKQDSLLIEEKYRETSLIKKLKNESIKVCISTDQETQSLEYKIDQEILRINQEYIANAFEKWMKPLNSFSKVKLTNSIEWNADTFENCLDNNSDLVVSFETNSYGRAHFSIEKRFIKIYADNTFGVILHEMGHAFGLADTYVEESLSCKPGHPMAVMCGVFSKRDIRDITELTSDDIYGVRASFCKEFPSDSDLCGKYPPPKEEPNLDTQGLSVFTLNILVEKSPKTCKQGVIISEVKKGGAGNIWGLKTGHCINSINEVRTSSIEDFKLAETLLHTSLANIWLEDEGHKFVLANRRTPVAMKPLKRGDFVFTPLPKKLFDHTTKALLEDTFKPEVFAVVLRVEGEWTRIRIGIMPYWTYTKGLFAVDLNEKN